MKISSRRQNVKIETKTSTPHSIITAAASPKTLGVSKKSLSIQMKPEKGASVQRTLVAVKKENGTKSLLVSKTNVSISPKTTETGEHRKTTERIRRQKPTLQVESKKTIEVQPLKKLSIKRRATNVQSLPTDRNEQQQQINCKYCNLHFSSTIWLKKHILRSHTDKMSSIERPTNITVVSKKPPTSSTKTMNISTYKKQIEKQKETIHQNTTVIKKSLAKQNSKTLKTKRKLSPAKTLLREQLKIQLETQRKLLQVQQEIFEKANKAQNDIYDLLAKLGDEDDDDKREESTDSEVEEEQNFEEIETMCTKEEDLDTFSEIEIQDTKPLSGRIAAETIVPEEEYFVTENYEVFDPSLTEDVSCVYLNQELNTENITQPTLDQNVVVVVRSDDGDEEFELVEIVEDQYEGAVVNENNEFNLEIVGTDTDGVHCRIVSDPVAEDITLNEVKSPSSSSTAKAPVKLDVGKISFKYKKESETETCEDKNEVVFNEKINKTQNVSNDYIQKMVQSAVQTADNKYECPICKEVVSYKYSLGPHILRLHANSKKKICPHCDRGFTCTGDLTRHIRIHTGDKPFKCTYKNCLYAFRASGDLHKHLRRHNAANVNIRHHVCKVCNRAFERNYDLKRHSLTHKRNEEGVGYRCEFCSKHFLRKDQHKAHVYRHLGIKPFKCCDCDRSFGDFSNCSRHIKQCQAGDAHISDVVNENIPLFICDICQKRFKSKVGIQQHIVKCAKLTKEQKELQKQIQFEEE